MVRCRILPAVFLLPLLTAGVALAQKTPGASHTPGVPYYQDLPKVLFACQCDGDNCSEADAVCDLVTHCLRMWALLWEDGRYSQAGTMADEAFRLDPNNDAAVCARVLCQMVNTPRVVHPAAGCPHSCTAVIMGGPQGKIDYNSVQCKKRPKPMDLGNIQLSRIDSVVESVGCVCETSSAPDQPCAGQGCPACKDCCAAKPTKAHTCACDSKPSTSSTCGSCTSGKQSCCQSGCCQATKNHGCCAQQQGNLTWTILGDDRIRSTNAVATKASCSCCKNCSCDQCSGPASVTVRPMPEMAPTQLHMPVPFAMPAPPGPGYVHENFAIDNTFVPVIRPPFMAPMPFTAPAPAPVYHIEAAPAPTMTTGERPNIPVQVTASGKRVKVSCSRFEARCNRINYSPSGDRIVLEGKVRLTFRGTESGKISAERVEVDVTDGAVEVNPEPAPTPTRPVLPVGFFRAAPGCP